MALRATSGLARVLGVILASAAIAVAGSGDLKSFVSLSQVAERRGPNFVPVMEGEVVAVQGRVSDKPMAYPLFAQLAIQDEAGYGLILEGSVAMLSGLPPGALIEAHGTVAKRAGMPVLMVSHTRILSRGTAPAPKKVSLNDLQSLRNLGMFVSAEGRVVDKGEKTSGDYLMIGDPRHPLEVLLPRGAGKPASLDRFEIGDRVRASGIAAQYCPFPPYNRSFQLVLSDEDNIVLIRTRWLISPEWLAVSLTFLLFALGLWYMRERRMAQQRAMVRMFYTLGEDVIGVASPAEMLNRLAASLPVALKISGVHLYLCNRSTKQLDRVRQGSDGNVFSIPVNAPEGALPLGPAVCFRNQTLLTILNTYRSPFFPDGRPELQPGAVMFVPMFAESEIVGVLELFSHKTDHEFTRDDRILTQHLANQIGIALRLAEEKSIREQLSRSEKLAAVGQLISGIASELKSPLESISALAENMGTPHGAVSWGDVNAIAGEARKASDIVARLVSFMQPERAEPKRIELNALVRSLMEFRRNEWETRGFEIEEVLSPNPIHILGSQGQLERVFLDLLVQAEHAVSDSDKRLAVATSILARRALVEIAYVGSTAKAMWEGTSADSGPHADSVSRGVLHSHGGEMRVAHTPEGVCRLEIELPLAPARLAEAGGVVRAFTCMVVEPDPDSREEVVRTLTQRGCRVIPAASAEEGAELVQRLRFDIVFCAVRLPGLNWIEFSDGIRPEIGGFVLLTEGFDFELSRGLLSSESYVLSKPVMESELDQVLANIEARLSSPEARLMIVRPDRRASGDRY